MFEHTRFLDPTNDFAFKKVFASKGHEKILISLLNAFLKLEGDDVITEVEILPQEMHPEINAGKRYICDIRCKNQLGNYYIVEIQKNYFDGYLKRIQCYGARALTSQILKGEEYKKLTPVILLSILDHKVFDDTVDYLSFHRNVECKTGKSYLGDVVYVFVELPKYKLTQEPSTPHDYWMDFFTNWDKKTKTPVSAPQEIKEAYETLEEIHWSEDTMDTYFRAFIHEMDTNAKLKTAEERGLKMGMEKGLVQGLEQGLKEGIEKGIEQGVKKGKEEERKEMIKIMAKNGMSTTQIAKGLDLEEDVVDKILEKRSEF